MIELFKKEDTFKEEIKMIWSYRNFLDDAEDENSILKTTIDVLSKYYDIESFVINDVQNNSLHIVKNEGIFLSEDLSIVEDYVNHTSLEKDYAIYWNGNNKEAIDITSLYLTLLLKRIKKLHIDKNIKHFSLRDSLTGLYNRRFLDEFCSVAEMQHIREKTIYAVLMIDIDHFKSVNDTYGHQVGDEVIKALASLIKGRVRQSDVVTRYGGEEFLVLLYNTNSQGATSVAESMRIEFKQMKFNTEKKPFSCSLSCGIDVLNSENQSVKKVIENADNALYYSKNNGRDMISVFNAATGD